ncbi:chemotaxis protein CheW [Gracilinema caldarium]|uniref:CheW protein n=1 Tax=Gracilinema caldarium (strain ATCC 51460 / DSM 7334 / H1) TaxID=744872 RepID=F8EZ69_GRAC1|nr:chemotaxis protein CheW [Gracilinema caldarium]AEJ19661.1 CheW protein [Gracilinema caldarium DSM 7334]
MGHNNQYLTFRLEDEQYAVSVYSVREVLEYAPITRLPQTAAYLKGVINLRGVGIPVIDLRTKFGMPEVPVTKDTSIIVLDITGREGLLIIGALADSVQEVIELEARDIEPAPRFGNNLAVEYIQGIGKKDGKFIIILNMDKILSTDDVIDISHLDTQGTQIPISESTT